VAFKLVRSHSKTKPPERYTPKYTVVNIVSSGSLNVWIDLYKITTKLPEVEYEPEQFPGAIMRIPEPKCSFLLFKNGKIIIAGCKVEEDIKKALVVLVKKLEPFVLEPPKKK
jgi:transcription initiation factor TFIID TATA-box-binding protein